MTRVTVTTDINASLVRVWEALTEPKQVQAWDGVVAKLIPDAYPAAGQLALWRARLGPLAVTLEDRVRFVEPPERLASTIVVGFVRLEEEYRLEARGELVRLVSDNDVSSRIVGLEWLARLLTRSNVSASMQRLKSFCESDQTLGI